jgi:hypothetical protein
MRLIDFSIAFHLTVRAEIDRPDVAGCPARRWGDWPQA